MASLWYRGPEILLGSESCGHCGVHLDVWSLGCVIAEMLLNEPLFPGSSEIGMLFQQFKLLGTPHESSWPGVTSLANWSTEFPNFKPGLWHEKVKRTPGMHLGKIMSTVCLCCSSWPRWESFCVRCGSQRAHSARLKQKVFKHQTNLCRTLGLQRQQQKRRPPPPPTQPTAIKSKTKKGTPRRQQKATRPPPVTRLASHTGQRLSD